MNNCCLQTLSSFSSDVSSPLELRRKSSTKVEPIFPTLPHWPVIAEILSFAGYEQEIDDLLK